LDLDSVSALLFDLCLNFKLKSDGLQKKKTRQIFTTICCINLFLDELGKKNLNYQIINPHEYESDAIPHGQIRFVSLLLFEINFISD